VEGVTNKTGTIDIPAQSFWPVPFLLGSNNSMPTMHMYKNGYELASLMGYGRYPASVNDIASWANVYTKPIKVKRARTTLDLFEAVRAADSIAENLYQSTTDPCAWQKIPRFFLAVERGANDWKSRPKEEGWYRQQRTYDRELKNPVADLINSEEKDRRLFDCDKPSDVFKNFQDSEQ